MSRNYPSIAETTSVQDAQVTYGSRAAVARLHRHLPGGDAAEGPDAPHDPLGEAEREFVAAQDGFYLATVSESGWPYVQFRGGPPGFVASPDEHTLAWADFRGNRQYISTGNLGHDPRVAMIFMDHAHQERLKVFGVASIRDVRERSPYSGSLAVPGHRARVEREVRVDVRAFDWNCPQHITPRYTVEELAGILDPLRRRVGALEAENERLRARVTSTVPVRRKPSPPPDAPEDHA